MPGIQTFIKIVPIKQQVLNILEIYTTWQENMIQEKVSQIKFQLQALNRGSILIMAVGYLNIGSKDEIYKLCNTHDTSILGALS